MHEKYREYVFKANRGQIRSSRKLMNEPCKDDGALSHPGPTGAATNTPAEREFKCFPAHPTGATQSAPTLL